MYIVYSRALKKELRSQEGITSLKTNRIQTNTIAFKLDFSVQLGQAVSR